MNDAVNSAPKSKLRTILLGLAGVIVVGVFAGTLYWTYTCPCDRTPGFVLMGEPAEAPVSNWSFANNVDLCQIQIYAGWRPHSINLNCMSTAEGTLYLSCSACDTKYWASKVAENPRGRIRLDGVVYPITITRVTDPAEMDVAWNARISKLQVVADAGNPAPPEDAQRAEGWWTFKVESAI